MSELVLGDIVTALGGELIGSPELTIAHISPLPEATPDSITFLSSARMRSQLAACEAACVITSPALREDAVARGAAIITPDPYLYFARLTQWWAARMRPSVAPGIHPTAVIDASAIIGSGVFVGPGVVIEPGAFIGDGASIGAQCYIGRDARIGSQTRLAPRVSVMFDCSLGERCIVHSGVVIGADGFGFAPTAGQWEKIEQLGAVRIGDDVEIGANTCIDRGALGDTVLENGVKLDNLIQIGHNVRIGAHTAMAGNVGVAGSAIIGSRCQIGGAANILGHLTLADDVHVSVATVVTRSILKPGLYSGSFPCDDNASWEKNAATLRQLHTLRERIRALEKQSKS
ncbi:UDP-3-O-(3-hydroxymyristoyl)glucosamine N-acyltransferase [Aquabacterium sp.]|uniref:UDP-3-O-(3-hydroxymyristoyl)glucosamine N-acyltransferase n=1 Tax=Aquabacterium sp. TaxID=1872578 RepID=UPI0035AE5D83